MRLVNADCVCLQSFPPSKLGCWQQLYIHSSGLYSSGRGKQACLCQCVPNNPWLPVVLVSDVPIENLVKNIFKRPPLKCSFFYATQRPRGSWDKKRSSQHANSNWDDTLMSTYTISFCWQIRANFRLTGVWLHIYSSDLKINRFWWDRFIVWHFT